MCRYVLATKPSSVDKSHIIRTIFGNGLRPQIWTQFIERFNIPNVAEFYGATEGNANIGWILFYFFLIIKCIFFNVFYLNFSKY